MVREFSPKHIQHISFENTIPEHFIVLIIQAATRLNWHVGAVSKSGFIAYKRESTAFQHQELTVLIVDTNAILESCSTGVQIINEHQNKENVENLIAIFIELKKNSNAEELDQKYKEWSANFVPERISFLRQPPSTVREDIADFIGIFKPRNGYYLSPVLIDVNAIIFFLMVITRVNVFYPDQNNLIKWGANFTPLTLKGEWWRLLSCCFLHFDFLHLFMNMYALVYIGLMLEQRVGKARYITAFLLTGIAASITSLWWHDEVLSLGASGAIFGMYGVFLALLTTNLIERSLRNAWLASIVIFIGYSLIGGMKQGIDNAGHIGGLISGVIIGYAYYPGLKSEKNIEK